VKHTLMSDLLEGASDLLAPDEVRLLEVARDAVEGWGDGNLPFDLPIGELEWFREECEALARAALLAWATGAIDVAVDRAAQAATIEGLVLTGPAGYHELHAQLVQRWGRGEN